MENTHETDADLLHRTATTTGESCESMNGQYMGTDYSMISKIGNRDVNEDSADVIVGKNSICFVVADGLGGHGQGDIASQLTIEAFREVFSSTPENPRKGLSEAFLEAQDRILEKQRSISAPFAMKTTATALVLQNGIACWGHIGDSRLYCFQNNKIKCRTLDHSVPQMLVLAGDIKEREIRNHPDRNKLLRVLGISGDSPRFELAEPRPAGYLQAFLLCSDGFWELINGRKMCAQLRRNKTAKEWLSEMTASVENNGRNKDMDNYTAIAVIMK